MTERWYLQVNGHVRGPMTAQELRLLATSGTLTRETLVRNGDSGEWLEAGQVTDVFASPNGERKGAIGETEALAYLDAAEDKALGYQEAAGPIAPSPIVANLSGRVPPVARSRTANNPQDNFSSTKPRWSPPVRRKSEPKHRPINPAPTEATATGRRYGSLRAIASLHEILAILLAVVSVVGICLLFRAGLQDKVNVDVPMFYCLSLLPLSLFFWGIGAMIRLFIDIEHNTSSAHDVLIELAERLREQ